MLINVKKIILFGILKNDCYICTKKQQKKHLIMHKTDKLIITIIFVYVYSSFIFELGKKYEKDRMSAQEIVLISETNTEPKKEELPKQKNTHKKSNKKKLNKTEIISKYSISENGKNFIKQQEGCVLKAYYDVNGYSIGYGHHRKEITKNMVITQKQAEEYFEDDIDEVNRNINYLLKDIDYNFNQNFIDGLGSLIYNCGCGNIQKSEFYKKLNKCRWNESEEIIKKDLKFTLAQIKKITYETHKNRRNAEHALMSQL